MTETTEIEKLKSLAAGVIRLHGPLPAESTQLTLAVGVISLMGKANRAVEAEAARDAAIQRAERAERALADARGMLPSYEDEGGETAGLVEAICIMLADLERSTKAVGIAQLALDLDSNAGWNEIGGAIAKVYADRDRLANGLLFYADPETYFAVGFFPDPPCGPFMDDFDKTALGNKPGKLAREILETTDAIYHDPDADKIEWTKREPINKDPWWEAKYRGLELHVGVECEWIWGWSIDDGENADVARGSVYVGTADADDGDWDYQSVEQAQARCELIARTLASDAPDPLVLEECPGCGESLPESTEGLEIQDGAPLSCGCDGTWSADGDADVNPYPQHDDDCRRCAASEDLPRTPTLAAIEAGAERAAQRVARWPAWKRELGAGAVPKETGTAAVPQQQPEPGSKLERLATGQTVRIWTIDYRDERARDEALAWLEGVVSDDD